MRAFEKRMSQSERARRGVKVGLGLVFSLRLIGSCFAVPSYVRSVLVFEL